ncbi:MAG: UDP-2,4-diacetamido-2,4,6-trideoxy-beta-L-altropyranose hydrolase [Methyloprofundus sp.]|nr:UDP-2,4-diacetamido-2,4,6-trideoxy-beta-L-altropyranose hydrolase [Methyloprofundus sp.]MDT8425216.1 UDP-2,4-diacetamido-2,4,6-trideoxy-beta-L-altropyranose hydrolase [Methyloprofundus sp.]
MKVVFRTDASIKIGTGHVMRCLTLAKDLVEQGAKVQFICRDHSGNLIERIRQEGFELYTLITANNCHFELREESLKSKLTYSDEESPTQKLAHAEWLGVSQKQDANDCQPILEIINPDWLIVDHYAIAQAWQNALKPYYQKLMVIDDLGDRNHLCDLLLDQNYGSTAAKYQSRIPAHCKVLVGAHYALLRPEFAQWRETSLKRREQVQNIKTLLITLGGVDPDNYTGQILSELAKTQLDKDIEIIVIMGATAPHLASVKNQAETMPIKTTVKTNVINMAELMTHADLAIGAAGATTWERCCLGLPSIQLVIAENQRQIAHALAKDHVIKLIDQVEQLPDLVEMANQWINGMSQQAAKICDGLGSQRVVDHVLTMDA